MRRDNNTDTGTSLAGIAVLLILLIVLVLTAACGYVSDHLEDISLVSEDRHVSVLTLLGWIEQAARTAG